jgi:hypothetical protein
MKKLNTRSRQILSPARNANSMMAAFRCPLLALAVLGSIGAARGQQPEALTITKEGDVGIGKTPSNRLSVLGNVDFSGNVGIGMTAPSAKLSVTATNSELNGTVRSATLLTNAGTLGTTGGNELPLASFGFLSGNNTFFGIRAYRATAGADWTTSAIGLGMDVDNTVRAGGASLFLRGNGNIGIGTAKPVSKLHIHGDYNNTGSGGFTLDASDTTDPELYVLRINPYFVGGGKVGYQFQTKSLAGGTNVPLAFDNAGNVGIGAANPTKGKLQIAGYLNTSLSGDSGYLSSSQIRTTSWNPSVRDGSVYLPVTVVGPQSSLNVSLYASDDILAGTVRAFSDERIKRIEGRSDMARDLATLMGIEVTDYSYIDSLAKGAGTHKQVIGQQVEKVFSQAVSKLTDVVPDIYRQASFMNGWVALATNLKKGERVRLISDKADGVYEVLEVTPGKFRTDFKPGGERVFVFGREVNDFRTVDYNAIAMLNVSATQQIKKEKDEEVKALQAENAELKARLDALEAKDQARDAKLAAMEKLLLSAGTDVVRTDSTPAGGDSGVSVRTKQH